MPQAACRLILIFILAYLLAFAGVSVAEPSKNIVVVVSKRIRPYIDILDGINDGINTDNIDINPQFLSNSNKANPSTYQKVQNLLAEEQYDLYVAIGPEATEMVWGLKKEPKTSKLYTAVLNPENIIKTDDRPCGISLRIPVQHQVQEILYSFPGFKNIGLIYNADDNSWFFEKALIAAKENGLTLIPLDIDSKNQIPKVIKDRLPSIDCIWMIPDRTVISKKIIQYIIKQALYSKKGVIGYNSFFIRSGAVFSFEFDYKKIGRQTAGKIELYLNEGVCMDEAPVFDKIVNAKMVDKLGIEIKE